LEKSFEHAPYLRESNGFLIVGNSWLRLVLRVGDSFGPARLEDVSSGIVLADGYVYRVFDEYEPLEFVGWNAERRGECLEVSLVGRLKEIEVHQCFRVPGNEAWLEERIKLVNHSENVLDSEKLACGFTRAVNSLTEKWRLTAIPFRRELSGRKGEYMDFTLSHVTGNKGWFWLWDRGAKKVYSDAFGSEGWALTYGGNSLLVLKYSPNGIEYSLIESIGGRAVRFGGCGIWLLGNPEAALSVSPGRPVEFGLTRYEIVKGGWREAYYAFRRFMESHGHGVPEGYNPPVHWNELYDNPLWWGPDTPERRAKYYRLEDMVVEAEKAREIGCEALYLDPGWDTSFASSIWAEDRLGRFEDFVKLMNDKYGLKVSLHTPLAAWSDVAAYPEEARRLDEEGKRLFSLCMGSGAYIEEKARRLVELCKRGAVFLMFDGSGYTGPCFDKSHGHPIPYTREAHCRAILELIRRVRKACPKVLIELHDPIVAGVPVRYAPIYYLHEPGSFDEVWAFEYMWDPMDDLLSGRAISLYYYNLAYSLPLYIHIDLRKDNRHAIMFWWYASTCRHLGVGGKHPDPEVWEAHKRAMRTYMALKEFYVRGVFYGLDEEIHVHALPDKGEAVVNVFNLEDKEVYKEIEFRPEEIGFIPGSRIAVDGVPAAIREGVIRVSLKLPAYSHRLFIVKAI